MFRRKRERIEIGAVLAYDKNKSYVYRLCASYLKRHLEAFPLLDTDTLECIAWVLGEEKGELGRYLAALLKEQDWEEFREELQEGDLFSPEDYGQLLAGMLQRLRASQLRGFRDALQKALFDRSEHLAYEGRSEIEEVLEKIRALFNLSEEEVRFGAFLYLVSTHAKIAEYFVGHLGCNTIIGKRYMANALGLNLRALDRVLSGTLERIGFYEMDMMDLRIADPFLNLFQSPDSDSFTKEFFVPMTAATVPLDHHFLDPQVIAYMIGLLKTKPVSSTHILLYGAPGTGKTAFAKGLAQAAGGPCHEIVLDRENRALNRRASIMACLNMTNNSQEGSILLVDEADALLRTETSWYGRGDPQDKGWLNRLLEEPGVRMIWVTNTIDEIDESVLRRFAYSVPFKPFTKRQRLQLWGNILKGTRAKRMLTDEDITQFSEAYAVSAGAIDLAVKKALEMHPRTKRAFRNALSLSLEAHQTLMNGGDMPSPKGLVDKNYTLEGLNIKGDLTTLLKQVEKFDQYLRTSDQHEVHNMNLLFYGPPGTGKTQLALYIARHLNREILSRRASDFLNMYVGETEHNIRAAFEEAEEEEAILVIDEVDSFLLSREKAHRAWEISMTNELLSAMEEFRGILICTTNRFKDLDDASVRRFQHKIGFHYLTKEGNLIFYERFLLSLIGMPLSLEMREAIRGIPMLAPGDFKTVHDRFYFHRKRELSHPMLIEALASEAKIKKFQKGEKEIGF